MYSRREFLNNLIVGGILYGNLSRYLISTAHAQATSSPILLKLNLAGGPDFRHLLPPPPSQSTNSYGYNYWSSRYRSHAVGNSFSAWNSRWNSSYDHLSSSGTEFGILNSCSWLVEQWNAGNVAIINNVYASTTRDHHHSQVIFETGDMSAGKNDTDRDGFGGRLASAIGANVLSFTPHVRQFCYQPNPLNSSTHLSDRIVAASDTRNMGLFKSSQLASNSSSTNSKAILERSLKSYYSAKQSTIGASSPFKRFVDQEKGLRDFDALMQQALNGVSIPSSIQRLYEGDSTLNRVAFGRQIRNVYDAVVARSVLNFRIGSMDYGGWDTHRSQLTSIERSLTDIFGGSGGFASLYQELSATHSNDLNNMVIMIGGEFGRQLNDNGDSGTDHGSGMSVLLIGNRVNGGIYGDMFPSSELADSSHGFQRKNADILGRTSIEVLYQRVADFINGSALASIVAGTGVGATDIESAGLLDNLFS